MGHRSDRVTTSSDGPGCDGRALGRARHRIRGLRGRRLGDLPPRSTARCRARARGSDSTRADRGTVAAFSRRLRLLGLRPDRDGAPRQPVRRPAQSLPAGSGVPADGRRLAPHHVGLRASVDDGRRDRRGRGRRLAGRGGLDLQGPGRPRGGRTRCSRRSSLTPPRLRRCTRRLEPASRPPLWRRWPQRRADDGSRRRRTRPPSAWQATARRRRLGSGDRDQVASPPAASAPASGRPAKPSSLRLRRPTGRRRHDRRRVDRALRRALGPRGSADLEPASASELAQPRLPADTARDVTSRSDTAPGPGLRSRLSLAAMVRPGADAPASACAPASSHSRWRGSHPGTPCGASPWLRSRTTAPPSSSPSDSPPTC